jgi:hypothetical protein
VFMTFSTLKSFGMRHNIALSCADIKLNGFGGPYTHDGNWEVKQAVWKTRT